MWALVLRSGEGALLSLLVTLRDPMIALERRAMRWPLFRRSI